MKRNHPAGESRNRIVASCSVLGGLALALGSLTGCATRYETVNGLYIHDGPDRGTYSMEGTVVRDLTTGELWRINRNYPNEPLWEPFGHTGYGYYRGYGRK